MNFGPTDAEMQPGSRVIELLAVPWGVHRSGFAIRLPKATERRLNCQKAERAMGWPVAFCWSRLVQWTSDWLLGT